jgi:dihydroflavonol-4-reductase
MTSKDRVLLVGGTGFLGYYAVQALLARGWMVTAVGLPPEPPPDLFPVSVKVVLKNVDTASDEELLDLLRGHTALVYAAGMDDRVIPRKPSYPKLYHANVEAPRRLFQFAVQAGVQRAVVLGSYYSNFNRLWPDKKLAERHPYIRSRVDQEKELTSITGLEVCVLELPYIFGALPVPGWKPLWVPLISYLRSMKTIFYMKGGTACVSARTVGQAVLYALEHGQAGVCYPIGDENLTWTEMLVRLAAADGLHIRVILVPAWLIGLGLNGVWLFHRLQGREGGLDLRFFASIQTAETYLDPEPSRQALGYQTGGLDEAFRETLASC